MRDLADLDHETRINTLAHDIPGFVSYSITVGDVFNLVMGDAQEYIATIDMDWLTLVYRIHHREVIQWCNLEYAELIDEDYGQQAVNFVMASTLNWCHKFCEAYANASDDSKIEQKVGDCKVFDFESYRVRLH